jgi:YYY domain-containing protein
VWGLGLPLGLASLIGLGLAAYELIRKGRMEHLLPLVYLTVTFIYHAATFVKFMRYFLPLYPFLALFAAYLMTWLWNHKAAIAIRPTRTRVAPSRLAPIASRVTTALTSRPAALTLGLLVSLGTLLYAIAFSSIYTRSHPRVAASRWIYANIPAGSTLANEHWDDWLPIGGVDGNRSYGTDGMFQSVEMGNYEDDNPAKLDRMIENLTAADYIILSSNRLYDSIPRLPVRYPMTIRYYQLLFGGQLGFEPVANFTSYPTLLGLQISDQAAEESFSVYDHPKVQIFKKSATFSATVLRQALSLGIDWDSVLHLTPLQASKAPDSLRLSTADQALYATASTSSSANVSPRSLGSRIPVIAWFLVLMVIGLMALPLTLLAFRPLADRGYILAKSIGLLFAAWGAWLISSLHLAPFTWWLLLIVLALLGFASAALASRHWVQLRRFLAARWRLLAIEEALFWLLFVAFLIVRSQNPDLWHPGTGGEKPMDFAYLNAIVRTPYFPSYDPWFAGGYINYYYFGFVLVAALVHLTGIVPYIAYNLAIPTFFALTGAAAFSVALNLAGMAGVRAPVRPRRPLGMPAPLFWAGVCGTLFAVILGNLAQVKLLWNAVLALSTLPPDAAHGFLGIVAKIADGLNQWIGGRDLPIKTDWWYWNATRVIPAAQGEAGPINEMPYFTFLYADLHAHAMTLPYTLLALALALRITLDPVARATRRARAALAGLRVELPILAFSALVIGALWPMNTWDFPTYAGLIGFAIALRELGRVGRLDLGAIGRIALRWVFVLVLALLLFQPFHDHYASAYFGAALWKGSRSPLWAYLLVHGFFLFVLVSYMVVELWSGHGHNALIRSTRLSLRHLGRLPRLRRLQRAITSPSSGYRLGVTLSRIVLATVLVVLPFEPVAGIVIGLGLLAGLLLWSRPSPRRQFVLALIGTGLFLTGIVEFVVLKGDISRMNTVFKFYLQVWVLWAVASAAALPRIAQWLNRSPRPAPSTSAQGRSRARRSAHLEPAPVARLRIAPRTQRWFWAFGLLLAACLLYPLTATPVRVNDRFPDSTSHTLDGTAYMRTSVYFDDGRPVTLEWDRQAAEWLRANAQGLPTILEANTPLYRWGSRISIYTGFPAVIGWDWHQKQQRSVLPGPLIDRRLENVRLLYNTTDLAQAKALLDQLGVDYIVVGELERYYYDPGGLAKFDDPAGPWDIAYQNEKVNIYKAR